MSKVVLVRQETSPEDVHGMAVAEGILTSRGGLVSHAAVVARGWGKPAVCGAESLDIGADSFTTNDGTVVREGDVISVDGTTGRVYLGEVPLAEGESAGGVRGDPRRGPTRSVRGTWASGPTPTPARTRLAPGSSAPRASACAAPSTCSWAIGCRSCGA